MARPSDEHFLKDNRLTMKVAALAGGVGGAKLADGLAKIVPPEDLTIIVNTGDDFSHVGLHIAPDLDTVCYALAGIANSVTGWGQADETWFALESLGQLGGPTWFRLGDRDLGVHLERTRRLKDGQTLSQVTHDFCRAWGIHPRVLPMSDDPVPTWVDTLEGELPFQVYFVQRQCHPQVTGFRFHGAERASPAPGVIEALEQADQIIFCPSNPWVSIDPILAIPGVRDTINTRQMGKKSVMTAISPIVGGETIKGPAAKMYRELGIKPSALSVARHYCSLLTGFVLDNIDQDQTQEIHSMDIQTLVTDTIMKSPDDRRRLAEEVLAFGQSLK
jgi:LPPG:FO 2-phospho-L-lactate transferase